jgi:hypothetical protein
LATLAACAAPTPEKVIEKVTVKETVVVVLSIKIIIATKKIMSITWLWGGLVLSSPISSL